MADKKFFQIHRTTAIDLLLSKEKNPTQYTNLNLAELLEQNYPEKNRSYIVIEDDLRLDKKYIIRNVMEF